MHACNACMHAALPRLARTKLAVGMRAACRRVRMRARGGVPPPATARPPPRPPPRPQKARIADKARALEAQRAAASAAPPAAHGHGGGH